MTVTVFMEVDATQSVGVGEDLSSVGSSISPNTASPVLKSFLTITIDSEYTFDLVQEDLSVRIEPASTNDNENAYGKDLYVTGVDNDARTLDVKFGGAWSGEYDVFVSDATVGLVNMDGVVLTAIGTITDFNPK